MTQMSFSEAAYEHKRKVTRREKFLSEMTADVTQTKHLLHGKEKTVWDDACYTGADRSYKHTPTCPLTLPPQRETEFFSIPTRSWL